MRLELKKATDGTHFVICVVPDFPMQGLVVPLSPELSTQIELIVRAEGIPMERVFIAPHLRDIRHSKLNGS